MIGKLDIYMELHGSGDRKMIAHIILDNPTLDQRAVAVEMIHA